MSISNIKLVVGLGNTDSKYINTRHNIGFKIVDRLIHKYQTWPSNMFYNHKLEGDIAVGYKQLVLLLKPNTGMNNSGICVAKTIKELNLKPSNILVVYDDISIPFGIIRLREDGSAGGHNGIKSIIKELETDDFSRLKIGIGYQGEEKLIDYVLSGFTESKDSVESIIKQSAFYVDCVLNNIINQGDTFIVNCNNNNN